MTTRRLIRLRRHVPATWLEIVLSITLGAAIGWGLKWLMG
jgi:hypothetical protein